MIFTIFDAAGNVVSHFMGSEADAKLNVPKGGSYKKGKY